MVAVEIDDAEVGRQCHGAGVELGPGEDVGEGDAVEQLRRRGDQVVDLAERVRVLEGEQDLVHPVVRIEIVQVVEVTVPFQHVDQVPDRHRSVAQELQGRGADPGVLGLHVPVHMVDGTPVDRRMSDRSHRSGGSSTRRGHVRTWGPGPWSAPVRPGQLSGA